MAWQAGSGTGWTRYAPLGARTFFQSPQPPGTTVLEGLEPRVMLSASGIQVLFDADAGELTILGTEKADSDVDVMIIGLVPFGDVTEAVAAIQNALGREVNPSVYSPEEFRSKLSKKHHFLTNVMKSEKLYLIGDRDGLEGLAGKRLAD